MHTSTAVRPLDTTDDRPTRTDARPSHRRRARNRRRTLALVPALALSQPRDQAVRLHPVDLGPWDD